ncbi:MAG: saccharopine dehydrogenase NADP-binding domain-containing protein [Kangiellaceae bacterium]|jgi:short subunit dehydrogenase-like uncharacterized protein|nr:saccharopine dehydrogenase NADP-binding domain-containing protein [Kangiellaceae bacterium]
MNNNQYDIVLFGATSFVGQIIANYLFNQVGDPNVAKLSIAIAGRSQQKLEQLRSQLNKGTDSDRDIAIIVADSFDEAAISDMCNASRVVLSTVGPYDLYGETLVKVCAETGTDYCDLTGEIQFYKRMLDRYEAKAQETGARILHCCGFDSIPSDMGVFYLQQHSQQKFAEYCSEIDMRVRRVKGGFSGGTVASMLNIAKQMGKDKNLRRVMTNPYIICPESSSNKARQINVNSAVFDECSDSWAVPFIMAGVNTRVVLRSAALTGDQYSTEFKYNEAMLMGNGNSARRRAKLFSFSLKSFLLASAIAPTRWLMEKLFLPKPGEGPSPQEQKDGFYILDFYGKTASGKTLQTELRGDADPGYGSTAKIIAQTALCLTDELAKSEGHQTTGGFFTPASLLGEHLVNRLEKYAGLTFAIKE